MGKIQIPGKIKIARNRLGVYGTRFNTRYKKKTHVVRVIDTRRELQQFSSFMQPDEES